MKTSPLQEKVEESLDAASLLKSTTVILTALSGGADSLALFLALHRLAGKHGFKLRAAHVDHGLRGAESDADAAFVACICSQFSVPLVLDKIDVAGMRARRRLSWEQAARIARYDFLTRVAMETQSSTVALGHTSDDQAETVLLHLLRGTGIRGLRGMLPLSSWRTSHGSATLVRPLLNVSRQETEAYCLEHNLTPRLDSSNLEERFTRNRIRRKLMPRLEEFNPSVKKSLLRLARTVAQDVAYLDQQVASAWSSLAVVEQDEVSLDRHAFKALHPSLQAHVLHRAYAQAAGEASSLNLAQIEAMKYLAEKGAGLSLSLHGGVRFGTSYEEIFLTGKNVPLSNRALDETTLRVPGETQVGGWRVAIRLLECRNRPPDLKHDNPYCAYLSLDALGEELKVRSRLPGDRFQPLGLPYEKSLKEFMIDAHVPRSQRNGTPLFMANDRVAWVVGWRIAHWARVTSETKVVLEVSFHKTET